MRIAVLADIHGNLLALEAVLADLEARKVETIVELGDCVSGPLWPRKTFERLAGLNPIAVRGNHDRWVATYEPQALGDWDTLAYAELTAEQRAALRARPLSLVVTAGILACHAMPTRDDLYLIDEVEAGRVTRGRPAGIAERLGDINARLVLCAHSHRPDLVRLPAGPIIVNPGSVGCPAYSGHGGTLEAGTPDARYAIVEMSTDGAFAFEHIAVPYDHKAAARRAEENGRPEWAHALRTGFMPPLA